VSIRRSPKRWLRYTLASTAISVLALGVPLLSAEVGVGPDSVPAAFAASAELPIAEPLAEAPVEAAAPEPPAADVPAPTSPPEPPPSPCADALDWVAEAGLPLPAGVDYNCPSTQFAHHGAACWGNSTYCPGRGFIAINMDLLGGTSTEYLRHVVAHEVCHILDFQSTGRSTEPSADACAAAHGAPA
jgi:hypothetical protein